MLKYPYRKYTGGGELGLTNGIRGTKSHNDGNWQGFEQDDMEAVIDMGRTVAIKTITASFLQNTASWIFFPSRVEYALSDDGIDYRTVASFSPPVAGGHQEVGIKEFPAETKASAARYISVTARNVGLCPDWHGGRGGKAGYRRRNRRRVISESQGRNNDEIIWKDLQRIGIAGAISPPVVPRPG